MFFSRLNQTFVCFILIILNAAPALCCSTLAWPAEGSIVPQNIVFGLFLILIPLQSARQGRTFQVSSVHTAASASFILSGRVIHAARSEMVEFLKPLSSSSSFFPLVEQQTGPFLAHMGGCRGGKAEDNKYPTLPPKLACGDGFGLWGHASSLPPGPPAFHTRLTVSRRS